MDSSEPIHKLGEGGKGIVYKAEDEKLKREGAIESPPREIAAQTEKPQRFKIEAQAAGAPNRPALAAIYAVEEVEDKTFVVAE